MPIIKMKLIKGKDKDFLKKFIDEVFKSLEETLGVSSKDSNIFLTEYENEFFQMGGIYEYLIEITMYSGRTDEKKKRLFDSIVKRLSEKLNIKKESVLILIREESKNNWNIVN
jgi:4-oxalocrotonate tautomerase family enzyme